MTEQHLPVVNVIVAGVGGQGSILTSHLLAEAALKGGVGVRLAETFGAATRGGSVFAHVRLGQAWAPTIRENGADVVVSLEPVEGLRVACTYLKPGGWALFNTHPWYPVDVTVGRAKYPSLREITEAMSRLGARLITLDATKLAIQAGDARASNSVILGALFALSILPLEESCLFEAMQDRWPEPLVKINQSAYRLGFEAVKQFTKETQ
jgi:indolepyruvate ferredoxin oxidoreductase beta subunit